MKTINIAGNLTQAAAVAYNYDQGKVCWSDHALKNIQCTTYRPSNTTRLNINNSVTVISEVLKVDGLACDWFTNKLYWTDSEAHRIEVATLDGKLRKVLFWTDLDKPKTIALIPMKGLMVWTDWGEMPKIERAGMNGDPNSRKKIVTTDIFWPNGLTVDYKLEQIYWIDAKLSFIDVMDYDGKNRQRILQAKFEHPYSLTYFDNKFYYTDWKTWSIHGYDKSLRHSVEEIEHFQDNLVDVHVWNPECQKKYSNPCKNNGGCSHLCLLSPYPPGYTCSCPIGIKKIDNMTCADGPQEILLFAKSGDIWILYLDSPEYTFKVIPQLNSSRHGLPVGIDYDPVGGDIYWTDYILGKIEKSKLDGSNLEDVITTEINSPEGIAIDWISRNIYWIDTGAVKIEVTTIDKGFRKVLISDDLKKPRAIAVAPELGWLFWSDWNIRKAKIERANLDGTDRTIIVSKDLFLPNGITLDLETHKIYWCDAKQDKIEFSNMDGTDRRVFINTDVPHVFGLSLLGNYIYWTDWVKKSINRANKESGHREIIVEKLPKVMGLKVVNLRKPSGFNLCKLNNGNCSQICLPKKGERVCACQIDYELTSQGTECVIRKTKDADAVL